MVTQFPLDPSRLNSPEQVRSYTTYKNLRSRAEAVTNDAMKLDGTSADVDGVKNDRVVLSDRKLEHERAKFTGTVSGDGTLLLEGRDTISDSDSLGTYSTFKSKFSITNGDDGEQTFLYGLNHEHHYNGKTYVNDQQESFQINESEGWVIHNSEVTQH